MGKILDVTHFVMQFTHVFRHPIARNRRRKKLFSENYFENVVSYWPGLCMP